MFLMNFRETNVNKNETAIFSGPFVNITRTLWLYLIRMQIER